jgi:hypothetical protein
MIWRIIAILSVVWLVGLLSNLTMGGLLHLLLLPAVVITLITINQEQNPKRALKPVREYAESERWPHNH